MVFLVGDAITLIAVVIATWIMARWEHRKLSSYGLPGKNAFGRRFWEGAVFGYAGVSALILLIFLAGGYSAGSLALHGAALRRATLLWLLASLAIGFAEEYLFRGYPQFILAQGMGFWPAAILISFLFGALHYFSKPYERWPDWASTGLLALLICLTLRRTGDLRFAIGFHAAFDFGVDKDSPEIECGVEPDGESHRRFAIRHRVPRRIRFRGYLCLLRAERRAAGPGPLADRHVPRRGLAYRRKARARGQLVRVSGDRRDVPRVSRSVPRPVGNLRSEEHTSELQSPDHIVCRLL